MQERTPRLRVTERLGRRSPASGFVRASLALILLLAPLAACGKRGAPSPPGPPSQVTYPRVYPTQ